jgi:AraC-like DNA-binding protein
MVRYREWRPPEPLRPFVRALWMLELDGDGAPQRIVPDGHPELIVNLAEPLNALDGGAWRPQPRAFLAGQLTGPLLLRSGGAVKALGVSFYPHGAAGLFPQPMHELAGIFAAVEDLAPSLARSIARALDSPDRITSVERALCAQGARWRGADALVGEAVRHLSGPAPSVSKIARDFNLSRRQFERRFRAAVGLSPAFFARLQRFNRVYAAFDDSARNWADAAVACGYYDQAHLIRDCHALAGVTPPALLDAETDLARHFYRRYRAPQSYKTAAPTRP